MDLSVIIVNWNTKDLLLECLRSVHESVSASPWQTEVLVVDNASSDGSVAAVRQTYSDVQVIALNLNKGFSVGNNCALKFATGRYCLLLNSDALVSPGALDELIRVMDNAPQAAVCSPLLCNADGSPQLCWARFPGLRSELTGTLNRSQSSYPLAAFDEPAMRQKMAPFAVDWVGGACFLVRRQAIDAVGPMDEGFFLYSEETEWCYRFAKHGWQTLLVPNITVTHLGGRSGRAVPLATRGHMYRSILRLYRILYGNIGGALPSAVATARFVLFHLRYYLLRRMPSKPVQ